MKIINKGDKQCSVCGQWLGPEHFHQGRGTCRACRAMQAKVAHQAKQRKKLAERYGEGSLPPLESPPVRTSLPKGYKCVMKMCPKCGKIAEFGKQAYCRACWREYDRERKRIARAKMRQEPQKYPVLPPPPPIAAPPSPPTIRIILCKACHERIIFPNPEDEQFGYNAKLTGYCRSCWRNFVRVAPDEARKYLRARRAAFTLTD